MIKTSQCYNIWNATLLHCVKQPESYDAIKYGFKVRPPKNFHQHRDRFVYEKLAEKLYSFEDAVYYSIANINQGITYIRDSHWSIYSDFMKVQDALQYWFEEDLKNIKKEINKEEMSLFFKGSTSQALPEVFTWYRQKKLNIQTLMALQKVYRLIDNIEYYDNIYENVIQYIKKSSQLLIIKNKSKIKVISQKVLNLDDIFDVQ